MITRELQDWFRIKLYIIFVPNLLHFYLYGFRNVISTKPYFQLEEITTNFSYEIQNPKHYFQLKEITTNFSYEIQNHRGYLNVSRNIIT